MLKSGWYPAVCEHRWLCSRLLRCATMTAKQPCLKDHRIRGRLSSHDQLEWRGWILFNMEQGPTVGDFGLFRRLNILDKHHGAHLCLAGLAVTASQAPWVRCPDPLRE